MIPEATPITLATTMSTVRQRNLLIDFAWQNVDILIEDKE
jgi:Mrp family chromosome partitioning ATPase